MEQKPENDRTEQKPEKKKRLALWIACIVVIVGIFLARLICDLSGVPWSDTMTRVLGGVEMAATIVLVYTYVRWKRQYK